MSARDYAQAYRVRAANARAVDNAPVADWCEDRAAAFERGDIDWSDELTDCMVERLGASIARLEARDA